MVRAIHEWILANDCTPYIVVSIDYPDVSVPKEFVRDGQITLNISPTAVKELNIANSLVSFSARFGGVPTEVSVSIGAVVAIFAKENGQGMGFEVDPIPEPSPSDSSSPPSPKKPSLKVIK